MEIPIENIYYLLCYAWDKLDQKDQVKLSVDGTTTLLDLFAKILVNGTRVLLRRGVDRSYLEVQEEVIGVKGKMDMALTLKRSLLRKQKTACTFDEFSTDVLPNRILCQSIATLIRTDGLDQQLKSELIAVHRMIPGVSPIELSRSVFSQIRLNRNNRFYGFLLNVCELIFENVFPSEERGKFRFSDFTRDERKMNRLFEAFLRNYYKREQGRFGDVGQEGINWRFHAHDDASTNYLPSMVTDITLQNGTEKVIMDAKYYRNTVAEHFGKEMLHSGNLYQLFAYLLNQEVPGKPKTLVATGVLIYPTVQKEFNLGYEYGKHKILIRTLDLALDWKKIASRLDEILSEA